MTWILPILPSLSSVDTSSAGRADTITMPATQALERALLGGCQHSAFDSTD